MQIHEDCSSPEYRYINDTQECKLKCLSDVVYFLERRVILGNRNDQRE